MSMVLYRFDCLEAFPVIESLSSPGAVVETLLVGAGDAASIQVKITRAAGAAGPLNVAIALPPRSVVGTIDRLELGAASQGDAWQAGLDIEDEASGAHCIFFDAAGFVGSGVCAIDFTHDGIRVVHFHRLRLVVPSSHCGAQLRLISLSYSGDGRISRSELVRQ